MKSKGANSKEFFHELRAKLKGNDADEIYAIALALMEKYYNVTLTDILSEKKVELRDMSTAILRLNQNEPLQYVIGEADFFGRKFNVNPSVLIPRPETELLVREIIKSKPAGARIVDIGTGTGCIGITLNLEIPQSIVYALEISQQALEVAEENSIKLGADVTFILTDFLNDKINLDPADIIVSNPPYVRAIEKIGMNLNVLDYEPHLALFVPDEDPLLFYKAIALKSKILLKPGGSIFVEINENFGGAVKNLFLSSGFASVEIVKDFDGKDRIVTARKRN